jgi:putative transcriptional regulator
MPPKPNLEPAAGVLLVAAANLTDPNFARTVVLLCEHQAQGSFGLVLNRAIPLRLSEVTGEELGWDAPLYRGGPVQENTLHFIHRRPDLDLESQQVLPGLFWGGNFDKASQLLKYKEADPNDFRFFVGYSGWGEGQLDDEIKRDSWYLRRARLELAFHDDVANLWRHTLRGMGQEYAILAGFPDDPRLN